MNGEDYKFWVTWHVDPYSCKQPSVLIGLDLYGIFTVCNSECDENARRTLVETILQDGGIVAKIERYSGQDNKINFGTD